MKKIIKVKEIKNPVLVAGHKGEKIIREGMNYYYIAPKQPLEEKALLLSFEKGLELSSKIQRKADEKLRIHISRLKHKVLINTPKAKIIEGIGGKHDGAYYYVMSDGICKVISEELAKKMVRDSENKNNMGD